MEIRDMLLSPPYSALVGKILGSQHPGLTDPGTHCGLTGTTVELDVAPRWSVCGWTDALGSSYVSPSLPLPQAVPL